MLVLIIISIITALPFIDCTYNRSQVQAQYPGFGEEFILFPSRSGTDIYGYFITLSEGKFLREIEDKKLDEEIFYIYYNRNLPEGRTFRHLSDLHQYYRKTEETKLITHGWMSSSKSDYTINLVNAYIQTSDVNVIVMDWNSISGNLFYPVPMMATTDVAKYYAKLLNFLTEDLKTNPMDIHLIGHSLGAHISGFAARRLIKGKVGRITGLDPARPGFTSFPLFEQGIIEGGHLNKNDSHFVDIIHTCAGYLGIEEPIGHVDFYPNGGGPPQPGCDLLKFIEACSHGKSWKLFVESIYLDEPYMARECSSFDYLTNKDCEGTEIPMGQPTPASSRGIYYIKTPAFDSYVWGTADYIDTNDLEAYNE